MYLIDKKGTVSAFDPADTIPERKISYELPWKHLLPQARAYIRGNFGLCWHKAMHPTLEEMDAILAGIDE